MVILVLAEIEEKLEGEFESLSSPLLLLLPLALITVGYLRNYLLLRSRLVSRDMQLPEFIPVPYTFI